MYNNCISQRYHVKIQICFCIPQLIQKPSTCFHLNPISMWLLAREARCNSQNIRVDQDSHSDGVVRLAPWWAQYRVHLYSPAASQNQESFDFFPVEKFPP